METRILLDSRATELLNHPYVTSKGYFDGRYAIRHSDDIHFCTRTIYTLQSFAKKIGIKLPTPALLKKWSKMTDNNYHSELLVEIATWAKCNNKYNSNYDLLLQSFVEIKELSDNAGSLVTPSSRYCLSRFLLEEIKKDFGLTIYKQIHDCM